MKKAVLAASLAAFALVLAPKAEAGPILDALNEVKAELMKSNAIKGFIERGRGLVKKIREAAAPALAEIEKIVGPDALASAKAAVRKQVQGIWAKITMWRDKLADEKAKIKYAALVAWRGLINRAKLIAAKIGGGAAGGAPAQVAPAQVAPAQVAPAPAGDAAQQK